MPLLETRELTKNYGGLAVLRGVSLEIGAGEVVGLIGPNGAGKTTLFDLITGLQRPSRGFVSFEGRDLTGMKPHSICRLGISRTYQSVRPFLNHSVRENIAVGLLFGAAGHGRAVSEAKMTEILDLIHLGGKQHVLAKNLPIEQRKMVEVGRALAANPKLLLLDEPMAGLNAAETIEFVNLIKALNARGLTIVVVEHVMKAISSSCSRVVVLHLGQILAQGSPEDVLSDRRVVDVYLGESYSKPKS